MDIFESCQSINDLLSDGSPHEARNQLIQLLDEIKEESRSYPQYLNKLIREAGLYPYIDTSTASWQEQFIHNAFSVNIGTEKATLHREQSTVLAKLLDGRDIAVSAPTSFGKSFIIDAFITIKDPKTVVILVPTIALMDETRRRLYKKFSRTYNIITTSDIPLAEKNIFIFPQERVFSYISKLEHIDLLVIDEFYKASFKHDKERSPSLVKAILKLSHISQQRYYLAPNIKKLTENSFTKNMEFLEYLDFNTVFLKKFDVYKNISGTSKEKKAPFLLEIINKHSEKSLIYAGSISEIKNVSDILISNLPRTRTPYSEHFSKWIRENYSQDWELADLAERSVGIHTGRLHRSLSQIQIKLFEYPRGFNTIISTSSIIEGVNTSAENVIIWRSKLGNFNLKDFTYKNIIGRGGRMFKHFVGKIYLLESPPREEDTQLDIEFPDQILGGLDEITDRDSLSESQIEKVIEYKSKMTSIIGKEEFKRLRESNLLQDSDSDFLLNLALSMQNTPEEWNGFSYLNSDSPSKWDNMLYKIIKLKPGAWDTKWSKVVNFTKIISKNWQSPIPEILEKLKPHEIDIEDFFQLERSVTFKLSSLLSDANELHKIIVNPETDISKFVWKVRHAFLPSAVYELEEYGLPRMISRKLHLSKFIDFNSPDLTLPVAIQYFQEMGEEEALKISSLSQFDKFVLRYFYAGITPNGI